MVEYLLPTVSMIAVVGFALILYKLNQEGKASIDRLADKPVRLAASDRPARIHLQVCDSLDWTNPELVDDYARQLAERGFDDAGQFAFEERPTDLMRAFVKPEEGIRAIIRENEERGLWIELVTVYDDGGLLEFSTVEGTPEPPQPPGHFLRRLPGLSVRDLHEKMLRDRPARPMRAVSPQSFATEFEEYWAKFMDWFNLRGGLDEMELRAIATAQGLNPTDADVARWRDVQEQLATAGLREALYYRLFALADLSKDERYRLKYVPLYFIHERLPIDVVTLIFRVSADEAQTRIAEKTAAGVHDEWLDSDLSNPLSKWSRRRAFAALNACLPENRRFPKIAELDAPIAADVYAGRSQWSLRRALTAGFPENRRLQNVSELDEPTMAEDHVPRR